MKKIAFLLIPVLMMLVGCMKLNEGTGTLVLDLENSSARGISREDQNAVVFDIYFDGDLVASKISGTFYTTVTPGMEILVHLKAFLDGNLVATGESEVLLKSGVNNVTVKMTEISTDSNFADASTGGPATVVTVASFETGKYALLNEVNYSSLGAGQASGITMTVDTSKMSFNEGSALPVPTFTQGTSKTATFVGWAIYDDDTMSVEGSDSPSKIVLAEHEDKILIAILELN